MAALPRLVAPPLAVGLAVLAAVLAGCGSGAGAAGSAANTPPAGSSVAERRLERADLVIVNRGLQRAEGSIRQEVSTSKAAWPVVAHGLPASITPAARHTILTASLRAQQIATPRFISYAGELTGSAAAIAGLVLSYEGLSQRGWAFTLAAANALAERPSSEAASTVSSLAASGPSARGHTHTRSASPAAVRFLRANASLYIGCVYDAHYNLSAIGQTLLDAYRRLGGAASFGAALPPGEVQGVARFYSPPTARLAPRPPQ